MRVLIVEDDFTSRYLMETLISRYGNHDIAMNGFEAIELYKIAFDEERRYDLICLDINMPEISGQDVLKRIREIEDSCGIERSNRVKIVMTTAYDDYENIANAFVEQCDAFLVKPIEVDKFDQTLRNLGLTKDRNLVANPLNWNAF